MYTYHKLLNLRMTVGLLIAILSTLKLLFAQPVLLLKASYFNPITKLWNFVSSRKSPSSFSSMQSFKQFVYKTMFTTTLVNTYEVERSCTWILVMTTSDVTSRSDCAYHVHFLVLCYLLLLLTYI